MPARTPAKHHFPVGAHARPYTGPICCMQGRNRSDGTSIPTLLSTSKRSTGRWGCSLAVAVVIDIANGGGCSLGGLGRLRLLLGLQAGQVFLVDGLGVGGRGRGADAVDGGHMLMELSAGQ